MAPVLDRADGVHPAPQGALRRAAREAGRRPRGQGAAGQGGRGARRLDRLGPDRGPLPRPDARSGRPPAPRPRDVDDALWKRFRGAQDTFFGARDAANAELDEEFAANAEVKEQLLVEAEALLPVTDLDAAKRAFRDIAERWDAAGKVPRDRMKELEGRIRKVEQAIRGVEDEQWRRSDPEKSARADDMVAKLETAIAEVEADLEKARAAGNEKKVTELEENLASRQSFLEMAKQRQRRLLRLAVPIGLRSPSRSLAAGRDRDQSATVRRSRSRPRLAARTVRYARPLGAVELVGQRPWSRPVGGGDRLGWPSRSRQRPRRDRRRAVRLTRGVDQVAPR